MILLDGRRGAKARYKKLEKIFGWKIVRARKIKSFFMPRTFLIEYCNEVLIRKKPTIFSLSCAT